MKNKILLFSFFISFSLNSMEFYSCLKTILPKSSNKTKSKSKQNKPKKELLQKKSEYLWIRTNDNHLIVCDESIIIESAWFILAYKMNLFNKKEKPLRIKVSHQDFTIFIKSISNPQIIKNLTSEQQDKLLSIAHYLKAQNLYAYFIHSKLPSDISEYCSQLILPINKMQNLLIKNIIKNSHLNSKDYPLKAIPVSSSLLSIKSTSNPDVCIIQAPIKKYLYGCPLYVSIIMNIQNGEILHTVNNYKICISHPTKNIIIFAQPIVSTISELFLYNFDDNTFINLPSEPIATIIFSPNGTYFATTHPNKNFITLWHQKDYTFTQLNKHTKPIDIIAFNPNNTHLISGSTESNSIISWNLSHKNKPTILSKQENHLKNFIFNKEGTVILAVLNNKSDSSLLISNEPIKIETPLKTPLYALYNAPFIPEPFFKEETNNGCILHDHYSLLASINKNIYNKQPLIKINPFNQSYVAVYEKKSNLTLYTISSNNVKDKILTNKEHFHSLEFNKYNFLLAASNHRIILWDKKGNELKTICPEDNNHIAIATFNSNGEYILSLTSSLTSSSYFFNVIPINKELKSKSDIITTNFSTQQAIMLEKLIKQNKNNDNTYRIKSAFEKQIIPEIKPKIDILFNNKLTITNSSTL